MRAALSPQPKSTDGTDHWGRHEQPGATISETQHVYQKVQEGLRRATEQCKEGHFEQEVHHDRTRLLSVPYHPRQVEERQRQQQKSVQLDLEALSVQAHAVKTLKTDGSASHTVATVALTGEANSYSSRLSTYAHLVNSNAILLSEPEELIAQEAPTRFPCHDRYRHVSKNLALLSSDPSMSSVWDLKEKENQNATGLAPFDDADGPEVQEEPLGFDCDAWIDSVTDGKGMGHEKEVEEEVFLCSCLHGFAANETSNPVCPSPVVDTDGQYPMCQLCDAGYKYVMKKTESGEKDEHVCLPNECTCSHGVAAGVTTTVDSFDPFQRTCWGEGEEMCQRCDAGYHLVPRHYKAKLTYFALKKESVEAYTCEPNVCTCQHGTAAVGDACLVHNSNTCSSCDKEPIKYFLTTEDNCEVRPCNDCFAWCNNKMDENAWYVNMKLETEGFTFSLPDMIHAAVGRLIPLRSVALHHVEYAYLVDSNNFSTASYQHNVETMNLHLQKITNSINNAASLLNCSASDQEDCITNNILSDVKWSRP